MAQLQRDFLALIPNFTKENIQSFNSIHFIDAENMIGKPTFKTNFVKRYVRELNSFISQYLDIYNDENSLFIISAGRNFIASSFYQYKGLEKKNIYSIPSYGKDGADLVLVEALIKYLFSTDLLKFPGKIYIASSDKKFPTQCTAVSSQCLPSAPQCFPSAFPVLSQCTPVPSQWLPSAPQ